MLDRYPETVKIAFKHYPLAFHKFAKPAAIAAIAAQKQGKFWEFHDLLFENHKSLSFVKITEIARQLQLDMTKFANSMKDKRTAKKLTDDMKNGKDAGVTGTPAVYINGRKVKERNFEAMRKMIDAELAKIKK